jgi:CBS domain-containing protein
MAGLVSVRRIFKFVVELGQGGRKIRTVGSIMSGRPVAVSTASPISDAIKGMIAKGTCAAMVLANGEPKGIFTSRDVMNRVAVKNIDTRKTPVEEVMTDGPIIVSRSALLSEVFLRMYEGDFRHMPIRGEKGDLVGMVTMAGVIKYAKVLDVDGTVRRAWKEIKEFWESEAQYTPG